MQNTINEEAYILGLVAAKLGKVLSTNPYTTNPDYASWLKGQNDQKNPSPFAQWQWGEKPQIPKNFEIPKFDIELIQTFKAFACSNKERQIRFVNAFEELFQYRDILKLYKHNFLDTLKLK